MAITQNTYTGDGSTVLFSFTFPYIAESDIKITLDGTPTTAYTLANATTVQFNTAPANGVDIRIYRDTDIDTLSATFFPGSAIRAEDLNNNYTQNNYAVQEIKNNTWDVDTGTIKSNETWVSNDEQVATTAAIDGETEIKFDTLVQNSTPVGSDWRVGKTWLDPDDDLTLSVWNGSAWLGIASGGTFTNQPKVVYVDAASGDDNNDGHRISRPKATIKAAVTQINNDATYGDGSVVVVAPGTYQEVAPIDIQKANVSIVGTALRSCIVHPTVATETNVLFRVNSGSYLQNLTFTGVKASGSIGNTVDPELPVNQGWNVAFYPGATIIKSPYIQNCTNFSDSEIDNSNINVITPAGGAAGDTDSAPTGGGLLVDGSAVDSNSPLRSMVCDSYTHVGLNGPGILVTNNGYAQCTSSYAFFNTYHIKCLNGGQANLAASTTDFGDRALVADGKSTSAIFTADLSASASDGDITFTIDEPVADASWHGTTTRPQGNMLVVLNGITYPVLSATANGTGWDVTISRPNPSNRSENLGLNGAVTTPATAAFYLRSMIASSGHTMEYVGSGTDYRALPENGGVPDDTKQKTELNNGKIWTATTDHNGKFTLGGNQNDPPIFEVDQQTGFVTIPTGSISFDLASDTAPQLGGNLDVNGKTITSVSNGDVVIDPDGTGKLRVQSDASINGLTVGRGKGELAGNTTVGLSALYDNTTGNDNTAIGYSALSYNTTGNYNTAVGSFALELNKVGGIGNTAVGYFALRNNTTGYNNTAIGYNAGTYKLPSGNATDFDNCTYLGYNTSTSGDNQVQLGNSSTTTYVYNSVQSRSDARDKADIRDTLLGLDFIKSLRPVDFRWDYREDYFDKEEYQEDEIRTREIPNPAYTEEGDEPQFIEEEYTETVTKERQVPVTKDGSRKRTRFHHGLIAQEVKSAADAQGVDFAGYQDHSVKGGLDVLSLGYTEMIAPLIKAVQQLSAEIETLQARLTDAGL